ncbi:hypothetical protein ACTXT7_009450 [Hymenolepis weldensis]
MGYHLIQKELKSIIHLFERARRIGSEQPLVKSYFEHSSICLDKINETRNVIEDFGKLDTDFERICYFLKQLQTHSEAREAVRPDGVQRVKEDLRRCHGRSDALSKLFRLKCKCAQRNSRTRFALHYATLAVFYAKSEEELLLAFANRSIILYEIGLIDEAISDANKAVKGSFTPFDTARTYICLGNCYKHRGKMREALDKFSKAIHALEKTDPRLSDHIKLQAERQVREIYELNWNTLMYSNRESICSKPKVSELKKALWKDNFEREHKETDKSCKLLATNGTLALKNTKSDRGWTLEVTRLVKPGEVLAIEKCYAASLPSRWARQCYSCFQTCHNLIPCNGCPLVGFCSDRCAQDAVKPNCRSKRCVNKHTYDCKGFGQVHGNFTTAQAACACIANTDPSRLLDFVCSTGDYIGGRGHQAFVGAKLGREAPPPRIDPSDYSSVAFLTSCSDKHPTKYLLQCTIASIFLTYCLYIGGYPMKWSNVDLYAPPSTENRPKYIPASWVAACILYHMQAVDINAFNFDISISHNLTGITKESTIIGAMLYPSISLINHSCNPSAFLVMSSRGVGCLVALKTLTAGSEISIQYVGDFYEKSKEERQKCLKSFYFECSCEACINEWTYHEDSKETLICPLCKTSLCSTLEACPLCSSTSGPERYRKLWNGDFRRIFGCMLDGDVGLEILKTAADASNQAQSLVLPPAKTIKKALTLFKYSMFIRYGNWVVEPWSKYILRDQN